MKDEDPRRQYVKKKDNPEGFLDLKGFYRAVNSEMQAIKKMKPIDWLAGMVSYWAAAGFKTLS
jgi:hypothetical protein